MPAQYDLRNLNGENYVTPVKNQSSFGTCWAYAAMSAAETSARLKGASPDIDLSEKALAWYAYQLQGSKYMDEDQYEGIQILRYNVDWPYDFDSQRYSAGGYAYTAPSQMMTWNGASTEEQIPYLNSEGDYLDYDTNPMADPYGDWTLPYEGIYNNAYHLQNSEILEGPGSTGESPDEFTPRAKEFMLKYGALQASYRAYSKECDFFNAENSTQYVPERNYNNHAVTVVGWDDNYPAENFNITPPGNGAWIIKNSWGAQWGDEGYFYLSYYDQTIQRFIGFDVETEQTGFSYDRNHQYDFLGLKNPNAYFLAETLAEHVGLEEREPGSVKMANVFTSES